MWSPFVRRLVAVESRFGRGWQYLKGDQQTEGLARDVPAPPGCDGQVSA